MYELLIANKNYSSWSLRAWVLLAELGIDFEERLLPFTGDDDRADERLAATPAGKVPCLIDGSAEGEPVAVWDSLAIAEYLAERHPGVWPEAPVTRAWARCATAEMHSGFPRLRDVCSMNCGVTIELDDGPRRSLDGELARIEELWSEGFVRFGGPFLAGSSFTAVGRLLRPDRDPPARLLDRTRRAGDGLRRPSARTAVDAALDHRGARRDVARRRARARLAEGRNADRRSQSLRGEGWRVATRRPLQKRTEA